MSVKFYDVKTRQSVEVADSDLTKVRFESITKSGATQVRFGLRGHHDGRSLVKFVSRETWDATDAPLASS